MARYKVWPGRPYPLGANWDGQGTNFSVFSENAEKIELLLYASEDAGEPEAVIPVEHRHSYNWHVYLPEVMPPKFYAYRAYGPYDPASGQRFNPAKVLLDPYAKAIAGTIRWDEALFAYPLGGPEEDFALDQRDSGPFIPKCVVTNPFFDWEGDRLPKRPWSETVIYEVHVKDATKLHHGVEASQRGTYAGLASPAMVEYFMSLGVTAIELLPVHHHVDEWMLKDKGLVNHWGYNTIGFFAPDSRYSSLGVRGEQVNEFRWMVKQLHKAGIEVILDVVYNHTAEGNHLGPTLCFRGLDNLAYYQLSPEDKRFYMDFTGCSNGLNMAHPQVTQFIMDSLRYWVQEMHVDGFRFDLAAALARELLEVNYLSAFFDIIHQDPVISQVKLIAEPWDLGAGGYQVGRFPPHWVEWNGKYRDTVRGFWKGEESGVAELAYRLSGSSDLYLNTGRKPYASINFITAHDGFTLRDLVSYNDKHNEANQEENRDGSDHNQSWNCGVEGPTDDPDIKRLRVRQMRNLLTTVLLSQGVPMLLGGDEFGRSKQGNNNTYCHDNEFNWFDWGIGEEGQELLAFTRQLISLRRAHPVFRRRSFFQGRPVRGSEEKDLLWLRPDGQEMSNDDWNASVRTVGMRLGGDAMREVDDLGQPIVDDTFLLLLNGWWDDLSFRLPDGGQPWERILDTFEPDPFVPAQAKPGSDYHLRGRSLVLFHLLRPTETLP
ncbi:MAG: glycogen debranching protein GlgX [Desulfuromonadales bacterium]|nr:glycogen debranching protein GlgX [Desulfuromonadales bacterium]